MWFDVYHVILLKVYYTSFSAFTACTLDWLINGRSLVKTKLNHLINSECDHSRKQRRYCCKTWKLQCENTQWKVQYMVHEIRKIQYQFAGAKIAWLTWWCSSRFTRYCTLNSSYCKKPTYIFCLIVLQTLISVIKSTRLAFKICRRRVTQSFLWIILIWFC